MRRTSDNDELCRTVKDAGFERYPADETSESGKMIIRTAGEPEEQFSRNSQDILKVFRYAAQCGAEIEEHTLKAACEFRKNLRNVPILSKAEDLTEIICSDPRVLLLMEKSSVIEELIPELHEAFFCDQNSPYHFTNVGMHTVLVIENTDSEPVLRWAALLHDLGKMDAKTTKDGIDHFYGHPEISAEFAHRILEEYGFSDDFTETVVSLVTDHDRDLPSKKAVRRYLANHDINILKKLLLLKIADALGHKEEKLPFLLSKIDTTVSLAEEVLKEKPIKEQGLNDPGDSLIKGISGNISPDIHTHS